MKTDRRWVVERAGEPLAAVLSALGVGPAVLADGRVFVGRQRMGPSDQQRALAVGDEVWVYTERAALALEILGEHSGVIAVHKPAGISTQPDHRGAQASLLGELARQLGEGMESLHALQRLDREVSGVVLVARDEAGRRWVQEARAVGRFKRRYLALTATKPQISCGEWNAPIGRGKRPGLRRVDGPAARPALTRYALTAKSDDACLLRVEPQTGRTHQIRVHAAHAGLPLLGDRDYGGVRRISLASGAVQEVGRIALHALCVELQGAGDEAWRVQAPLPPALGELWTALGGNPRDFARASDEPWL